MNLRTLLLSPAVLALAAAAYPQASFTNQTSAAGIGFVHAPAADHPAGPMSGGGAAGDFDGDSWPDLFCVGGGGPDQLYMNNGDGTFREEAAAWGLSDLYRGTGAAVGDYDRDGDLDLLVTSMGPMSGAPAPGDHRLYRNEGGHFVNVAAAAGTAWSSPIKADGFSAAFGDYDNDGWLDIAYSGWQIDSEGNRVLRNNRDGSFSDVTTQIGIFQPSSFRGFTPRFADMDGDRWPELIFAADFGTSRYYRNNRDGTITNITGQTGTATDRNGMGSTVGDFNNDGRMDWFVTAIWWDNHPFGFHGGNRLYMNQGSHLYQELPENAGVNDGGWGWGVTTADVDHDGWYDVVETNGWPEAPYEWVNEPSYIFRNNHDDTYTPMNASCGFWHTGQGRGMVSFDYDRDGDMDFVIFAWSEPVTLLRNDISAPNCNWLEVELDTTANPFLAPNGVGARVEASFGGMTRTFLLDGGPTYLSQPQLCAHFGLGAATVVDELRVKWSDGRDSVWTGVPANQILTLSAPEPLAVDPLQRGMTSLWRVEGCRPNELVIYLYSVQGTGSGPCRSRFGNLCLDLNPPIHTQGTANADAAGVSVLPVAVPSTAPLRKVSIQAVVVRGLNGSTSVKTNAVTTPILP
ncbi:MAG: CRTAC1 family protein [Planctomycetota bacterium]|nr:MAG: CRTAC1 family protein [Planctomycetota bacterium]